MVCDATPNARIGGATPGTRIGAVACRKLGLLRPSVERVTQNTRIGPPARRTRNMGRCDAELSTA